MLKITAYIHGKNLDNILFVNLIFLLDAKTIGIVEIKNNSCMINVFDNQFEIINNILYQIFGTYLNIKSNEYEINGNFIPRVMNYINNKNVEYNFVQLGYKNTDLQNKNYTKIMRR